MGDLGEPSPSRGGASRPSSVAVPASLPRRYHSGSSLWRVRNRGESVAAGAGLQFCGVCVDVKDKRILWDITGHATPGRVLAIMGPSGSGKSTLLNTLASHTEMSCGTITFNGIKMTKKMKRHVSYVLQADIFFPNLTLRETLRYSALLRLPREYSFREKLAKVESIISTLHLEDCANTLIGSATIHGLSGGEKKRANIGCELLTNPSMLLLDEPTSGLDSSSALSLMETLYALAKKENKIVVTSIHQPSSQMYHMFDDLLLLAKGKVAYFGEASHALSHFSSLNLHCTLHYNPADFILEMVTNGETRKALIGEDPVQDARPLPIPWWKRFALWARSSPDELGKGTYIGEYPSSPQFPRRGSTASTQKMMEEEKEESAGQTVVSTSSSRKWPTAWWWQLLVLIVRTFRQSRHVIISKLNCVQAILLSVVVSLVWFQVPDDTSSINDRYGYFFFTIIFWSFQPLIVATLSLPSEHAVISKERRSGSYHLSAYYLAKLLSELPLVLMLPSIFLIITYWCGGFNGFASFFGIWLLIIVNSIVAQGMGLMIGAIFMDFQRSLVAAAVMMLTLMLLGGFYVRNLPFWLNWAQYVSFVSYTFSAALELGFWNLELRCLPGNFSDYASFCNGVEGLNATISGADVLLVDGNRYPLPWYFSLMVIIAIGIVFRIIAYIALRFLHRKGK